MVSFYQAILDWVFEDEEIGLVIKPKKSHFLDDLPEIINQINELKYHTKRVVLIENAWGRMPISYLNGIDMVVGISGFFPSAVVECVVHGSRAMFYDYFNMCHHEVDFYQWAENKVTFPNLNEMVSAVKAYKNDPSGNPLLGDWSGHLDELEPFRDSQGGERIGTYMNWLQGGYKAGQDRDDIIERSNRKYAECWGVDKIYWTRDKELIE